MNRGSIKQLVAQFRQAVSLLAFLLGLALVESSLFAGDLIAHYRFDTNGADSLGRSPPFLLTNGPWIVGVPPAFLVPTAPFTNGVLFVNGLYEPNGHRVHYLGTEPIPGLAYDSFTVSLDFYPLPKKRSRYDLSKLEKRINDLTHDHYLRWRGIDPNSARFNQENLLTGGYYYRWLGFNRSSGVLNLTLNNQSFVHEFRGVAVEPDRWHNLICSVDLRRKELLTMFDGQALETIRLPSDFKLDVLGSPQEGKDREFTFADYSKGSVFYGYVANLKIFGRSLAASELPAVYSASLQERPGFPKPKPSLAWLALLLVFVACLLAAYFLRRLRDPPTTTAGPTESTA